jgi:predicted PhzF superfamily epimerase YddE/YHI9
MPELTVLRVFCGEDGGGGNPLGVVLDGSAIPAGERQAVAAELGFSETVFVDGEDSLAIFTPKTELDFAGHPVVGAAWLIARERGPLTSLRTLAGESGARVEGDEAFVTAEPGWGPPWEWERLPAPADVDALDGPRGGHDLIAYWAWLDEGAGAVRARAFPVRIGIAEDEATGSAALRLCAELGRPIEIHQGAGSLIRARPGPGLTVEIGGLVRLDEQREL